MRQRLLIAIVCAAMGAALFGAQTQAPQTPRPSSADPYLNNPAAGTTAFPLAAAAGADSHAREVAPPGAVNQGVFDPATWHYGTAFSPPAGSKIWTRSRWRWSRAARGPAGRRLAGTVPR